MKTKTIKCHYCLGKSATCLQCKGIGLLPIEQGNKKIINAFYDKARK